jgi:hypothetical protein
VLSISGSAAGADASSAKHTLSSAKHTLYQTAGWTARRAESEESVSPLGLWISAEEEIPCAKFRTHSRSAFVLFRNALSQVEDQMATPNLQTVSPGALSVGEICDEVGTKEDSSPREGTGKHDECRFSPLAPCLALLML